MELNELARTLVTPERYSNQQDTIEFDSREVARLCIEAEMQEEVEAEKARIIAERLPEFGMPFSLPDYGE